LECVSALAIRVAVTAIATACVDASAEPGCHVRAQIDAERTTGAANPGSAGETAALPAYASTACATAGATPTGCTTGTAGICYDSIVESQAAKC
jgi:hypothetical protein